MIMNVRNITEWKNEISITHKNSENMHHKMKKNDQKNHYMKYWLKNDNEYKKITITKNTRKSSVEKNVSTINAENIIQKNKKHDENLKNQNIMWKKKYQIMIRKIRTEFALKIQEFEKFKKFMKKNYWIW